MTVKQLKKALSLLPDEMEIILQKDAEGNGYSPLRGADSNCIYITDSKYSGNVYSTNRTAQANMMKEDQWEKLKINNPRCLVLYPIE